LIQIKLVEAYFLIAFQKLNCGQTYLFYYNNNSIIQLN